MARLSLLIDVTKCTGCYNCFLACRDEYFGNDYAPTRPPSRSTASSGCRSRRSSGAAIPSPRSTTSRSRAMHCEDAALHRPWPPTGPCYRRADGIVIIDPEKAKGQKAIVNACPYRVIFWNEELEIPQKCTICAHLLDEGEKEPRCVEACPTGALVFGDLDDPESEIAKLVAAARSSRPTIPSTAPRPLVKYVGLPKRFIVGEVVRRDDPGECAEGVLDHAGGRRRQAGDRVRQLRRLRVRRPGARTRPIKVRVELAGYGSMIIEVVTKNDVDLGEILAGAVDSDADAPAQRSATSNSKRRKGMSMNEVVIVSAVRTGGRQAGRRAQGRRAGRSGQDRHQGGPRAGRVEPGEVDEVIMGQAKQSADAANLARVAALEGRSAGRGAGLHRHAPVRLRPAGDPQRRRPDHDAARPTSSSPVASRA